MTQSHLDKTIERAIKRGQTKRASPAWLDGGIDFHVISAVAAGKIMREAYGSQRRPPRPGYSVDLPKTERTNAKGWTHRGHWALSNRGGQYELMFHYEG